MPDAATFELLANLFRYPDRDYVSDVERCIEALYSADPQAAGMLRETLGQTRKISVGDLQALYTSTFDLDPVCSLEVGWHLFGENYERGEFLVKMRSELRRLGLPESTELPDHLTHALAAFSRMESDEAECFAAACLFPALDKMRTGMESKPNPFSGVLRAVVHVLERRYARLEMQPVPTPPIFNILNSGGV
jgi:nitrate reductase delta subunit